MKKKWVKRILLVLLIPTILFSVLIVALYIPAIQNYIQREATHYASKATGMDIKIRRVDLRFPLNLLLRDVAVIDTPDTLLTFERLNLRVQVIPLLKKKILLDELKLNQTHINTGQQLEGLRVFGDVRELQVNTREIDLDKNLAHIGRLFIDQANLSIELTDTTTQEKDTLSSSPDWTVLLNKIEFKESEINLNMPLAEQRLKVKIPRLDVDQTSVDLAKEEYGLKHFALSQASFSYRSGGVQDTVRGIDFNNLHFSDLSCQADSIFYSAKQMQLNLNSLGLREHSGLIIDNIRGRFHQNEKSISAHNFTIETPQSEFLLNLTAPMDWCETESESRLDAKLHLSLQELATVLGVKDERFDYSKWGPIKCKINLGGSAQKMEIEDVYLELSDSFIVTAAGALKQACGEQRQGQLDLLADLYNLSCFNGWLSEDNTIHLPKDMVLRGLLAVDGSKYQGEFSLSEASGLIDLKANYNSETENYLLEGQVDSLDLNHFLPQEPLHNLSMQVSAQGQGLDFFSPESKSLMHTRMNRLIYGSYLLNNISLDASLKQGRLFTEVSSDNTLLKGSLNGYYDLIKPDLSLDYNLAISHIDLYELRLLKSRPKEPAEIRAGVYTDSDSINLSLNSGDLELSFGAKRSVHDLLDKSKLLLTSFLSQLEVLQLDYKDLQSHLPDGNLSWSSGNKNIVSTYLRDNNIKYSGSSANLTFNPMWGINGWAGIQDFQMDSVRVDSLTFEIHQDTTGIRWQAGAINDGLGTKKETAFRAFIKGLLAETSGRIDLDFEGSKGAKGLLLGVEVTPHDKHTHFVLSPQDPVIAFKKFKFRDKKNWLFLRDDFRIYSDIDLQEDRNIGFKMYSNDKDTTSLQNMNVDIRRIDLNDVTRLFPFLPQLDGLFSAEASYIQKDSTLQVSTELFLDSLKYEKKLIGDLGLGITWLPDGVDKDLLDMYLTHNRSEVLFANGIIHKIDNQDSLHVYATLEHFPLHIANAFFPNEEASLEGDIDGYLEITGSMESPVLNGELVLDSVVIKSKQTGAKFYLSNRPVPVVNSKVIFKDFSIYTTSDNPFKINGTVDISEFSNPIVDLRLEAANYTLLNAKRTKESLVYGKLFVDVNASLKGPVEALKMKGNMSILDNTDVTYVLTESPLTVQDRLGDLVTFTSFRDTTELQQDTITHSLGGLDMVMSIHIDPSVQFKVDLSADRSSRIALQGGGDLSLQYTPQGEFFLMGKYALSDGIMKYSLPVIPSKEFRITNDSYIEWSGKVDNPKLNLIAKDRVRASVTEADGNAHMVNFDVIIGAKNRLDNLELIFDVGAPENVSIQNQLASMDKEERSKQAIGLLATGVYLAGAGDGKGQGLDMGMALNSVLQSQINAIAGSSLKNASFSVGVEEYNMSEAGGKRVDYSFRYSQRFLNNRFQLVLGGRIKTGVEAQNDVESFIDNVSLEYRLDSSGTRFVRLFHNKNYESVLEGEITETGVGIVLRKKLNNLGELFIFKKKKKNK